MLTAGHMGQWHCLDLVLGVGYSAKVRTGIQPTMQAKGERKRLQSGPLEESKSREGKCCALCWRRLGGSGSMWQGLNSTHYLGRVIRLGIILVDSVVRVNLCVAWAKYL